MNDRSKIRLLGAVLAVALIVIALMAYKFIVAGSTEASADGRTAILLAPVERDLVLAEMRGFVEAVRDITGAIAREDMPAVAAAAKRVGMGNAREVPASVLGKLPIEFKKLGFSVHGAFDQMALDAEQLKMPKHALEQLSDTLARCAGCHATYRIEAVK